MTTITHSLDRIERESGVDVTRLVGTHEAAGERFREAYAVATSQPSVANFRACVAAYDELQAMLKATLDRSAA